MHGNVWEWVEDWYGDYPSDALTAPLGPSKGSTRVVRGGSWRDDAIHARAAGRDGWHPSRRYGDLGFRLAR
ncbi:SUMF1/EgtB/PvdO family nonheme iron enzyme [Myxococcota bacterium]|nr:SUMF1/EgtB/PvdO family nonheme iron enzyme [Myxococcota bacterium]